VSVNVQSLQRTDLKSQRLADDQVFYQMIPASNICSNKIMNCDCGKLSP